MSEENIILIAGTIVLIALASAAGYYHVLDGISLDTLILMSGSM